MRALPVFGFSGKPAQLRLAHRRSRSAQTTTSLPEGESLNPPMAPLKALTWTGAPPIGMRNNWSWSLTPIRNQIASSGPKTASCPFSAALTSCGRRARPGEVEQIQAVVALVLRKIGVGDGEHRPAAVTREFGRAQAVHHVHVGRGHRAGRERCGGKHGSGGGEEQRGASHAARVAIPPEDGEGDRRSWWRGPTKFAALEYGPTTTTLCVAVPLPVSGGFTAACP